VKRNAHKIVKTKEKDVLQVSIYILFEKIIAAFFYTYKLVRIGVSMKAPGCISSIRFAVRFLRNNKQYFLCISLLYVEIKRGERMAEVSKSKP
jgi:hypothetical protein